MKSSMSNKQTNKISVERLISRLDQIKHRISELEDKVDEVEHSDMNKKNNKKV
jgi:hypothetical protein